MFDLFGIKRRKQEKIKNLEIQRSRVIQSRKGVIFPYLDEKRALYQQSVKALQNADKEKVQSYNSSCPNCGSSNVINKFVRGKGDISGQIRTSPMLKVRGDIRGSYDTLPVNECRDCGNQWEKATIRFLSPYDYKAYPYDVHWESRIGYTIRRLLDFVETGDELNIPGTYKTELMDIPREVMECLIYLTIKNNSPSDKAQRYLTSLSARYDTDMYSEYYNDNEFLWTLKDSLWEHFKSTVNEKTSDEKKRENKTD